MPAISPWEPALPAIVGAAMGRSNSRSYKSNSAMAGAWSEGRSWRRGSISM
jgi:hypothetical protein